MDVSLDEFSELLENSSEIKDTKIRVLPSPNNSESVIHRRTQTTSSR